MVKTPVRICAALVALAALALSVGIVDTARAQAPDRTPNVEVSVDRTDMTTADVLTLTIKVEGIPNVSPPPTPPAVPGLRLVGQESKAEHNYSSGTLVTKFQFRFMYRPVRTGAIEIDAQAVVIESKVYVTDPIEINVTAAAMPNSAQLPAMSQPSSLSGQDLFLEAEVDNDTPYIGEQIIHTIRYYSTSNTNRPIYDLPDYAGFWNPNKTILGEGAVSSFGRRYNVKETRTILFPTLAGSITIEPTTVTAQSGFPSSPRVELATRQVELNVRQLPPNDPSAFTGAVGRYDIAGSVDVATVPVGEPVVLTVTVSGEGNAELLPAPAWPEIPGWRSFDNDTTFTASVSDGKMVGSKTFKRMLVPDISGVYDLPPVEYAYFDPESEEYVTVATQPFRVEAVAAPGAEPNELSEPADGSVAEEADIRYIKPAPASMRQGGDTLVSSGAFRALWLAPVAAFVGVVVWLVAARRMGTLRWREDEPGAGELALARLADIEPGASSADAADLALHGYLTAALSSPTCGLTAAAIGERLAERGVSAETTELLRETLAKIDEMRFSPRAREESDKVGEVSRDVAEIVRQLDEELAE